MNPETSRKWILDGVYQVADKIWLVSWASPRPSRASSNRALYFFDYDNHVFELDAEDLHDDATVSNTTSHTDSDCPAVSAVRV